MTQQQETRLISLLGQVTRLEHARSHELLEDLGLYRGQHRILRALWREDGVTQSDLARQAHVRPATMSTTIQRMETAGLVERKHDSEDHRISRVYITAQGQALQAEVEQVWQQLDSEVFADFTPEERMLLRRLFLQMRDNLDQVTRVDNRRDRRRKRGN